MVFAHRLTNHLIDVYKYQIIAIVLIKCFMNLKFKSRKQSCRNKLCSLYLGVHLEGKCQTIYSFSKTPKILKQN
jgi:hypothetical protein